LSSIESDRAADDVSDRCGRRKWCRLTRPANIHGSNLQSVPPQNPDVCAALDPAQVQQLALARLILANPDTLILDEATSLLSPGAARHLERSLAAVVRGRTVIAIVHRLHTALDADRIAVIEDGEVSELGTHDELLAAAGSYASLWHAWQGAVTAVP
jgi:ABC-type sugar transport system ATPase subunit